LAFNRPSSQDEECMLWAEKPQAASGQAVPVTTVTAESLTSAAVESPLAQLKFPASDNKVAAATPDKRKGPCMARRGQVGTIAVSGRWYVVRFWKYTPGQDRIHASERISPTDSKAPGYLPRGGRRRRANEIVAASGVNDGQQFIETNNGLTFREQAKFFLNQSMNRRRNPVKPATITTWQNCADKWLNPNLGDVPLASVNNAAVKSLVKKMSDAELSAKTISNYVGLVKLIVASAIDENGEQLFPRKWNHDFMDMPVVQRQHQPCFTAETISAIVQKADGQEQVLYVLLPGTGLRIGEALGLEVKHFTNGCRTIVVEQSCWEGDVQAPKTKNAYRQVDVPKGLADLLKAFVSDRPPGLVFTNRLGKPLSQTNLLRRSLHPILAELGVKRAGFHGMRRYRATWLRKQRAPEDLIRYWLGHAKESVTDDYSKVTEDLGFRLDEAEKIGLGFVLPESMRPMRPNKSEGGRMEVAD
jgi:integrase